MAGRRRNALLPGQNLRVQACAGNHEAKASLEYLRLAYAYTRDWYTAAEMKAQLLLAAGNPETEAAPEWRRVSA